MTAGGAQAAHDGAHAESIDAHQHFWQPARGDYGWLTPALAPIHRDFMPADLAPLLARHGIARTIAVQAAPTVAETRFLLGLARAAPFVAGVVGWVDLAARDAPDVIDRLAADPLLVGLRPMVQDIADDDWLAAPALAPAFEAMVAHRLVLDALVLPRHLTRLACVVARHPALAVVIDHAAKPPVREGARGLDPWRGALAGLAGAPSVACKLSGLVTEAAPDWEVDTLRPYVAHVLDAFAPARVLWGSDWPVVGLAGGYDRWRAATLALIAHLAAPDRAAILGGNAARIYLSRDCATR
jgi:L-fuconolactonase